MEENLKLLNRNVFKVSLFVYSHGTLMLNFHLKMKTFSTRKYLIDSHILILKKTLQYCIKILKKKMFVILNS